jgi:twinkle protein
MELFPEGKVESGHFKIGSTRGDDGRSLSVILNGEKAGQWTDFESGEYGDMLDLIMAAQGCSLKDAMEYATKRFGLRQRSPSQKIKAAEKKTYNTPKPPSQVNSDVLHQFLEDRGFRDVGELCFRHKIYATEDLRTAGTDLVFQFFDPNGKLVFLKNKPMDYEGDPSQCQQTNLKPILFGWQTVPDHARSVWITEGELDAIAARELGFAALSIPSGVNNMKWIAHEFDNLARFEDIAIATDHDEPGELCAQELLKRLGDKAFRVQFPAKDINDLLKAKGYDAARQILEQAFDQAKWQDPEQLRSVVEFEDEINDYFDLSLEESGGYRTGFNKIDENDFRLRSNDLIGITGINGHGKSMWLNMLGLNMISQGAKVCIASMEMSPKRTMGRMMKQMTGEARPDEGFRKKALDWVAPNLWLFVDKLTPKPDDLMKCFEYGYKRYGITVFVIDSLTNMVGQDDYKEQQRFVERLVNFKQAFPVTVFLVTHSRKGEDEGKAPNKFDVKGSGSITDLADSFISVWKNKRKADHLEVCEILGREPDPEIVKGWDIYVHVLKNRNGAWEGQVGFDFDSRSCQYVETRRASPKPFVRKPAEKGRPI